MHIFNNLLKPLVVFKELKKSFLSHFKYCVKAVLSHNFEFALGLY